MKFVKLRTDVRLPERSSTHSAGHDFYVYEDVAFSPGEFKLVDTHVKVEMPEDTHLQLHARSSLYKKRGFIFPNSPGIIDPDYTDSIKIPLLNAGDEAVILRAGERVAQGVFVQHLTTDDRVESDRKGGFGSSGK